jgi:hypothetical protein
VRTVARVIDVDARPKSHNSDEASDWKAEREILQGNLKDVGGRDYGKRADGTRIAQRFPSVEVSQLRPRVDFKNRGDPGRPVTEGASRPPRRVGPAATPKIDRKKVCLLFLSCPCCVSFLNFIYFSFFSFYSAIVKFVFEYLFRSC